MYKIKIYATTNLEKNSINLENENIRWNSFKMYLPLQLKNIKIFNLTKNSDLNNYLII